MPPTWVLTLLGIGVALLAIDRLFLWFEKQGWMYWRKTKSSGGSGIGNALSSMDAFFNPGKQHVVEAKEAISQEEDDDGDGDDPDEVKQLIKSDYVNHIH